MRSWGLGHADCADDADFFFVFSCPTDFTDKHRFMPCAGRGPPEKVYNLQLIVYRVTLLTQNVIHTEEVKLDTKWDISKIIPSFFFDKASCTRQFESELSLHSLASLFPIKEGDFSKITPSLFTLKEGSTSHPDPLTLRGEGGNRPTRCSEPLRSKDGGPSKVSPDCAGWDRRGEKGVYS